MSTKSGAPKYAGLIGYGPPTVGKRGTVWYSRPVRDIDGNITGIHWYKDKVAYKGGLEARVTAKATIAHPDWSAKLVAQILEGVIQDGGGTEVLGGHLVRVPPR